MNASESLLKSIEEVVNAGKTVISADKSVVVSIIQEALSKGQTVTFFAPPDQAQAVMRLYWSPRRIKEIGLERIPDEERARIESELGVPGPAGFSNYVQCSCGGVYGEFEFMEQGIREHGKDWVKGILELKNTATLRINPGQDAICPKCNLTLRPGHWYEMQADDKTLIYGCCTGEIP
jgi:hypothetical protein